MAQFEIRSGLFKFRAAVHGGSVRIMGQSFGSNLTLVEVVTDGAAGDPKRQLWVAAAKPEQAVTLVLCAVPEGWTAAATEGCLTPEQEAISNLTPGEVRELRHAWTPGN